MQRDFRLLDSCAALKMASPKSSPTTWNTGELHQIVGINSSVPASERWAARAADDSLTSITALPIAPDSWDGLPSPGVVRIWVFHKIRNPSRLVSFRFPDQNGTPLRKFGCPTVYRGHAVGAPRPRSTSSRCFARGLGPDGPAGDAVGASGHRTIGPTGAWGKSMLQVPRLACHALSRICRMRGCPDHRLGGASNQRGAQLVVVGLV